MKKGIIFDMDGTLWDSAAGVAESWNEAILAYGYERKPLTAGDIQSVMGKTMEDIADILFPELNVMQRKELLDLCCRLENDYLRRHGGVLYPGAVGYVSLDVLDDTVNGLKINAVEPTEENILAGTYVLQRPFVMATKGEISEQSEQVQAYFDFINSEDGQNVIKSVGLIIPQK